MSIAKGLGQSGHVAVYEIADDELPVGSTLGGPRVAAIAKASGALEKVFNIDAGEVLFGTVILRHYDRATGMHLSQDRSGQFIIHPEHQEHIFHLAADIAVHEDFFVLNGPPGQDGSVDPPGVYLTVELRNQGEEPIDLATYAFVMLRGETDHDVVTTYDKRLGALIAWNRSRPELARVVGCSVKPASFETSLDYAKAVSESYPGPLSGTTDAPLDPMGAFEIVHTIKPGQSAGFCLLLSFGDGRDDAVANYRACPDASTALSRTRQHYHEVLHRSVVMTPDPIVNRGVLWAKANMLRVEAKAPTGWCFTNDPTRSNNSVGRDTAWFAFGSDYLTPEFSRAALREYVRLQEPGGMMVEYYDIRTGKTEDYGLNINDNTPLLIMALWHHYNVTGDIDFLREIYPAACKAARYILSQRNEQGLVWCTATGTSDWGIVGWRNVIPNYRLSGATTELNSECCAALDTVAHMARVLGEHDESAEFADAAARLKEAINAHLYNPHNGLYYLHIDLDGNPRSDVTSDLVFPVMFGVAPDAAAAKIIGRLSNEDFWTAAGIRTSPRDAPNYTPSGGWGLLGGVWVGVSYWYAFAAARHSPAFMAHALSTSFEIYSSDPRRHNTVPGQFSEWLNGETLVNQGMMLSPWFPPRYLWAAIEGLAGFTINQGSVAVTPRLAPDWKWTAVQNLPFRDQHLTWFAARMPDISVYTNFVSPGTANPYTTYDQDISHCVSATGEAVCTIGFRQDQNLLIFVGNTAQRTTTTSVRVHDQVSGAYRLCLYDSLLDEWDKRRDLIPAEDLVRGITIHLERKGFAVLELRQEI